MTAKERLKAIREKRSSEGLKRKAERKNTFSSTKYPLP